MEIKNFEKLLHAIFFYLYICNHKIRRRFKNRKCGSSSVGRASAFQAECREFDPRLPLLENQYEDSKIVTCGSSSVGRASAFQAECRGFDPRLPLNLKITSNLLVVIFLSLCRYSSAVECFLGKEEVSGSSPDIGSNLSNGGIFFISIFLSLLQILFMKILILEDDLILSVELRKFLESNHYQCKNIYDGNLFMKEIGNDDYDFYLLDINVPGISGLEVCERIRIVDKETPIIIISAYGDISDKRDAYDRLADDYLVKPFLFEELLMRIEALKRRNQMDESKPVSTIQISDLIIDRGEQKVFRSGKEINLTLKEYLLLLLLAESPGSVFSKQQISEKVWGINFTTNTNTIEVYINFLRKKIDKDFPTKLIHTRSGFGYYIKVE